ncbi:hypothetical protein [Massilia aquatica]|uniref:Uncharacterized protein n=1 Tax=Massilia aquatica TaxID=2609000 RepID=A0ABX0LWY8_9BURK|nr:hypothetical protein [Massilia aquatica]NHZ39373.1 hypothetical protein [Massilia aquatica]
MRKLHTVLFCCLLIFFALYLRGGQGNFFRETITYALGFEWRAALEHLLAAFAVPTLCGILLSIDCRAGNRQIARVPAGWTNRVLSWMSNSGVPGVVLVFAFAYFALQFRCEWDQAFRSLNGAAARGYLQLLQIGADGLGCWFAYLYSSSIFSGTVTARAVTQ